MREPGQAGNRAALIDYVDVEGLRNGGPFGVAESGFVFRCAFVCTHYYYYLLKSGDNMAKAKIVDKKIIITTTENVVGKTISKSLGLVRGNTVRAKHLGRDVMAGLKQLIGGEISGYTEMITESRDEATKRMVAAARKLGADGVVCVRYTTSDVMPGASEVLAYGTAVKFK